MRPTTAIWLLCLFCLTPAVLAQPHATAETRYVVSGIDGYELIAGTILAPEGSQPKLTAVGLVSVDSPAAIVRVKAEDQRRSPVETQQIADGQFLVLGSGRLWITVTCVDFQQQIYEDDNFTIVVGTDPVPDPTPDDPDPPPPDDAPSPFPGPGLRVLIVYELDEIATYPADQVRTLYSKNLRVWANGHCAKDNDGFAALRILDKDTVGEANVWTSALARHRTQLPWIIVGNGTAGFEGPLPATEADTIALLQRFAD